MLAMTSIAITASICASASEAALLVASFMPFSLDSGVTHCCARRRESEGQSFTRNTPRRLFALIESPLSEYRPCQGQIVMRRHFDWFGGYGGPDPSPPKQQLRTSRQQGNYLYQTKFHMPRRPPTSRRPSHPANLQRIILRTWLRISRKRPGT
jgi:hypothetical protein